MIFCKELNRQFKNTKQMFLAIKAEKELLISLKKSVIKTSDPVSYSVKPTTTSKEEIKDLSYGDYIYPVINTTNYLDSHNDLHIDGIWNKSAKEQNGKTYYIVNHELAIGKVISYPREVEIMVKSMLWSDLGKGYEGFTEALIFKSKLTEKSNRDAYLAFQAGEDIQQSIRMEYVTIDLAINDSSKDFQREKGLYDRYIKVMVNKEVGEERGYFWIVSEAKIYKEGSAVLFGSNDATSVLYEQPKNIQPLSGTEHGPQKRTRVITELNNLLKTFK